MQVSEYENIYKSEGSHFFYVANHKIILALVKKYLRTPHANAKILDAGCGTGLLTKKLEKFGAVCGIDISPEAVKFARKRKLNIMQASVNKIPFKNNHFDLVVSMDVIYHKQVNDSKALKEFFRILKPGGILVARVPANKWLHLKHDEYVHTRERYSKEELLRKLKNAGFEVLRLSYANMSLLPFAFMKQIEEHFINKISTSGVKKTSNIFNNVLKFTMSVENLLLLRNINLPFGLGMIAVCKRV